MKPLQPPDSLHLLAAQGWLELGDHLSANEELERIEARHRARPDVLMLRWCVYDKAKHWTGAHEIANALVKMLPDNPLGWLRRSQSLHFLKRTQEAWDQLQPAAERFPSNPLVAYDLACYACQLGHLEVAKQWLAKAFSGGEANKLKLLALDDPDLEALWKQIGQL